MMKIGLVTCLEIPEADPDEEIQLEAIRQAGGEASLVPWDDSLIDLSRFDRLILLPGLGRWWHNVFTTFNSIIMILNNIIILKEYKSFKEPNQPASQPSKNIRQ